MSASRLPAPWGACIDREQAVSFEFDGRRHEGFAGDTLSSALAANGRLMLSRSFKYHRPRGSVSFAGWDANAYVQLGDEPNVQADLLPIAEGLAASSQNVLGTLDGDYGALVRLLKRFMPVGFYYRAFFRPRGIWPIWERLIRKTAGLGRINPAAHHSRYCDKEYLFCDVAVIGSGPAGLSAAIAAAGEGRSVLLIEEAPVIGGSLNFARFGRAPAEVAEVRQRLVRSIEASDGIRVLERTTASGWFADNWLSLHTSRRLYKVRAGRVVLATGSVEQPAVFRNNDLPGVMAASTAQRLMRLYGVKPGERAVIITANREGHDVAADLSDAGVDVVVVIDLAQIEQLEALPARGNKRIRGVAVTDGGSTQRLECDLLIYSIGYAPLGQLACHDGGFLEYDPDLNAFRVRKCPAGGDIAGSLNHVYELDAVLADGKAAGLAAAGCPREAIADDGAAEINHAYPIFEHPRGDEFVDFDEDQTIRDLVNAVGDGFDHPELAKRYSTTGMGPSQGRLSATNALRIVGRAARANSSGWRITTQRPPFRPISAGVLAGRIFEPERLTPMHDWHLQRGAVMMPAGLWQRPAYYGDQREASITREVAAVRNGVGMIDVSTLGGIEIRGPDASAFLERMYTFAYLEQAVGRSRYVLMIDDTGSIIDDGVAARLDDEHFYVTTTTTGSDAVYRAMQRRNAEWGLRVDIVNVTSGFAAMNIAGPRSREVVNRLDSDIDFSKDGFPYLGVRRGQLNGIPVMAMRVGFVGELGYELHVPSSCALELWTALLQAGESEGIDAVGVEAQRVLRLEKGHIIVGQDTDGLSNPSEADLNWAVTRKKPNFVGRAAIRCFDEQPLQRRLAGFELSEAATGLPDECNLVLQGDDIVGRVTSIAHSAELGKAIGLAYVHPDDTAPGTAITIKRSDGHRMTGTVVELPFLDPAGARQEA